MSQAFFGRYEVVDHLGKGAQSSVFLVRDLHNQNVLKAAKILKSEYVKRNTDESLIREFQVLESLDHENLVRVFECRFLPEDKAPVVITEFIPGAMDLDHALLGRMKLSFEERVQVAYQIFAALRYLHGKRVVHGDLKPSNILVVKRDRVEVKLIDFGVSRDLLLDQEAKVVGTPFYLAPEVATLGSSLPSDLYSLGVILFKLFISYHLPYEKWLPEDILDAHVRGTPLFKDDDFALPSVPEPLQKIMRQCLALEPLDRPRKLGDLLRKLRFDFPIALADAASPSHDLRCRETLGFDEVFATGKAHIASLSLREKGVSEKAVIPPFLFVCGAGGSGKTRLLHDLARHCQNAHLQHFYTHAFKAFVFDQMVLETLAHFRFTRSAKTKREKILKAIQEEEEAAKRFLYPAFFISLAQELDGLVLFADGIPFLHQTVFLEMIKSLAIKIHANRAKIAFVFSVQPRQPGEEKTDAEKSAEPTFFEEYYRSMIEQGKKGLQIAKERDFAREEAQMEVPKPVSVLESDEFVQVLTLPPWQEKELRRYLSGAFPGNEVSSELLTLFLGRTGGNPGLIQAVCHEALSFHQGEQDLSDPIARIGAVLDQWPEQSQIFDLGVYKLKYYDEKGKALLALIAACETISGKKIRAIWQKLFPEHGKEFVEHTLVRAFDDGLIQMDPNQAQGDVFYVLQNKNLKAVLRVLVWDRTLPSGYLTQQIFAVRDEFLTLEQIYAFSLFLYDHPVQVQTFLQLYEQAKTPPEKIRLSPYLLHLKDMPVSMMGLDLEGRERLAFASAQIFYLEQRYEEAHGQCYNLLMMLGGENTAFANHLRVKTQLTEGLIAKLQGKLTESTLFLEDVLRSELLEDQDHYFAMGNLGLCRLFLASGDKGMKKEGLEYVEEARTQLSHSDPIYYATITYNLAKYYMAQKEVEKALPLLRKSARVFGKARDFAHKVWAERNLGYGYFQLTHYEESLAVLLKLLPQAERLGMEREVIQILVFVLRNLYMLGDFSRLAHFSLQLLSSCEQARDYTALSSVIEPMAHAQLQMGRPDLAISLVSAHVERAKEGKLLKNKLEIFIGDLLLAQIYHATGNIKEAQKQVAKSEMQMKELSETQPNTQSAQEAQLLVELKIQAMRNGLKKILPSLEAHISAGHFATLANLREARLLAFEWAVFSDHAEWLAKAKHWFETLKPEISCLGAADRLSMLANLAKLHLDEKKIDAAQEAISQGVKDIHVVSVPLLRAKYFDQKARAYLALEDQKLAFRSASSAKKEFETYLRNWSKDDQTRFKEHSYEWHEHEKILALFS